MKLKDNLNTAGMRVALQALAGLGALAGTTQDDAVRMILNCAFKPDRPPMQPPIPWEYIDQEYNYMAMDPDGVWFVYTERPELLDEDWDSSGMSGLPCKRGADRPWTETLCIRPGAE